MTLKERLQFIVIHYFECTFSAYSIIRFNDDGIRCLSGKFKYCIITLLHFDLFGGRDASFPVTLLHFGLLLDEAY